MAFALPAYEYARVYRGVLRISTDQHTNTTTITIIRRDTLTLRPSIPVDPLGLQAVRLGIGAIKDMLRGVRRGNDEYPILFVFNPDYGRLNPSSSTSVAFLGGVALRENTNENDIQYMVGYSKARIYINKWINTTICQRNNNSDICKLYLTLLIDKELAHVIPDGNKVNLTIIIDNNTKLDTNNITLYIINKEYVNVYERTFMDLSVYDQGCVETDFNNAKFSLCPGDVEIIHLGSQLMLKGFADYISNGKKRSRWYTYYVMPIVISYPAKLPKDTNDVALPTDRIFKTAVLRLNIRGFDWNRALELVDQLWNNYPDALFKLFLNAGVIESLRSIFSQYLGNVYIPLTEYTVSTQLYDKYLINHSIVIGRFLDLYYRIRKGHSSIGDIVRDVLSIYGANNVQITPNDEELVKKVLAIYALIYGLHGISHLLMKALTALTGIKNYGELIEVTVDSTGLPDRVIEVLNKYLFGQNYDIYSENVFHVKLGSSFELTIKVFGRDRYIYDHFWNSLRVSPNSINVNKLVNVMKGFLFINNDDRCMYNWRLEKRSLYYARLRFVNNDKQLLSADQKIQGLISTSTAAPLYKLPRSLFRLLFGRRLVRDVVTYVANESSLTNQSDIDNLRRKINRYVQFMWPYYLEQCVDGCYSCVIMERNIRSTTCDMPPLTQELKTSKRAALYLLSYAGLL
ncbi:MAG: hypothetical protein QXP98_00520 [Thermoproteus sp.]